MVAAGRAVWVPDAKEVFVAGTVASEADGRVVVSTPHGEKTYGAAEVLPRADDDERVDDLAALAHMHDAGVLSALRTRYGAGDVYTYSGIVLAAVNPCAPVRGLYGADVADAYRAGGGGALAPHVYAVAAAALADLRTTGRPQAVVVSGESGAGKTVSARHILSLLAGGRTAGPPGVEDAVLATGPVLEALGNARTARNENSSRFGKYATLFFNSDASRLTGASLRVFLLERTRVSNVPAGERNYHVLYQLAHSGLAAQLQLSRNMRLLPRADDKPACEWAAAFAETQRGLTLAAVDEATQGALWRVLSAVLHLGELSFPLGDNDAHLNTAAELLRVDPLILFDALTTRTLSAGGETLVTPNSDAQAAGARDALVRLLYGRAFEALVMRLNDHLAPPPQEEHARSVSLLDIYGFERMETNSLEQLCINYANERLHRLFSAHFFEAEQDVYAAEGVPWERVPYADNADTVAAFEAGRPCLLGLLDEEARLPNGSDASLVAKITALDSARICAPRFGAHEAFVVRHYAYDVQYAGAGLVAKNRDAVAPALDALLSASADPLISALVARTKQANRRTTAAEFADSLRALVASLEATRVHYVRCVKPNAEMRPGIFDAAFVHAQLRACGVLETVRISAAGFPGRWAYADFCSRFRVLFNGERLLDDREWTAQLLLSLGVEKASFRLGKTLVFLRAGVASDLEERRAARLRALVQAVQRSHRRVCARRMVALALRSACALQSIWRRRVAIGILQTRQSHARLLFAGALLRALIAARSRAPDVFSPCAEPADDALCEPKVEGPSADGGGERMSDALSDSGHELAVGDDPLHSFPAEALNVADIGSGGAAIQPMPHRPDPLLAERIAELEERVRTLETRNAELAAALRRREREAALLRAGTHVAAPSAASVAALLHSDAAIDAVLRLARGDDARAASHVLQAVLVAGAVDTDAALAFHARVLAHVACVDAQDVPFWAANLHDAAAVLQWAVGAAADAPFGDAGCAVSRPADALLQMRIDTVRALDALLRRWLRDTLSAALPLAVSGILDSEPLPEFREETRGYAGIFAPLRRLGAAPPPAADISSLLLALDGLVADAGAVRLQREVFLELLSAVLRAIAAACLGQLAVRTGFATWRRGIQIQYSLSRLEAWVVHACGALASDASGGCGSAAPHAAARAQLALLEPLLHAAKALQLARTAPPAPVVLEACPALGAARARRLLAAYVPDAYESRGALLATLRGLALAAAAEGEPASADPLPEAASESAALHLAVRPRPPSERVVVLDGVLGDLLALVQPAPLEE